WRVGSRHHSVPCPVWLRWLVELDSPFTKTNRAAVIVERLDLQPGMVVLDAGCGPGRLAIPLAQHRRPRGEVVGLDHPAGMLERAREKAGAANLGNIRFLKGGLGEGKLGRNRFDRSVLVTVLGEAPDREAALREIFDALKPGGILSVTEIIFDPHFQSRPPVARLARSVGFREQALHANRAAFTVNLEKRRDAAPQRASNSATLCAHSRGSGNQERAVRPFAGTSGSCECRSRGGLDRATSAVSGTPGKEVHRVPQFSGPLVSDGLALVVGFFRRRGGLRGLRCGGDRVWRRLFRWDR